MDYTREPIVETVITPKDGYRIAVRSSKIPGQEEYIVEALEVVSFGTNCFFRNLERPKAFMVPASDYEVLEVREARVSLKAASLEGTVRMPSREAQKPSRIAERHEAPPPKEVIPQAVEHEEVPEEAVSEGVLQAPSAAEGRHHPRRERRRGQRRRRGGREEEVSEESPAPAVREEFPNHRAAPALEPVFPLEEAPQAPTAVQKEVVAPPVMPTVIPPPTTLIRDDLERLRRNKQYEGAFYIREPEEVRKVEPEDDDAPIVPLRLQGEEESRTHEEPPVRRQEENIYKASPSPIDDE